MTINLLDFVEVPHLEIKRGLVAAMGDDYVYVTVKWQGSSYLVDPKDVKVIGPAGEWTVDQDTWDDIKQYTNEQIDAMVALYWATGNVKFENEPEV